MIQYISQIFKIVVALFIFAAIIGAGYVGYNNFKALDYTATKVVDKYIKIIENPSKDAVTNSEKEVLSEIVETSTIDSWLNKAEGQVKSLRNFKQDKPVKVENIIYSGNGNDYATVNLTFDNNLKNPESKIAKLYLQRQGSFYQGFRWKIYQIDLPKEDNPIDEIKDKSQNFLDNLPNPFQQ